MATKIKKTSKAGIKIAGINYTPKKKKSGGASQATNNKTPTLPLSTVVKALTAPSARLDETARRFVSTVANPFDSRPSRGITNASQYVSTACIRRRNVCTVTLNPGVSGCDIFIPQGTTADPWVYVATNANAGWTGATTVSTFNYDSTVTVPASANGRVVASGVRIVCIESATNTGGVFYHYWSPHGVDGAAGNTAVAQTFGASKSGATEAISIVPVKPGQAITFINPSGADWGSITDSGTIHTSVTTGTPTGWPSMLHGTRLYYDGVTGGSGSKFIIEVVSILEYYHDSHKNFTEPNVTHANGAAVTAAVNAAVTQRSSNASHVESHGGHGGLVGKLQTVVSGLEAGEKAVMSGMKFVYNGIKGFKAIKNVMGAGEALVALA